MTSCGESPHECNQKHRKINESKKNVIGKEEKLLQLQATIVTLIYIWHSIDSQTYTMDSTGHNKVTILV